MRREALIFYSAVDDGAAWRDALARELPDLEFRTDPDQGDPADVRYALAWLPPQGFFQRFPNIELVTNLGAGTDALLKRDDLPPVAIARLSDPGMVSLMSSYVLFAVTRYARDIHIFERAKARGEWHYVHPRPLHEIHVGVLGLGELGAAAARHLAGLGYRVSGWARSQKQIDGVDCTSGPEMLDAFLAEPEILVVMLPLTPGTRGLIDARALSLMRPGVKLINASRGAVVVEDAMIAALKSGQIGEATLDVFEVEPLPPGHPLWTLDNVLITPHLASITVPAMAAKRVAENIRRVRAGEPVMNRVDPARGY